MDVSPPAEMSPAYLTVDNSATYELAPNTTLTIGRLESNNVILDDYKVSREHALLKYNGYNFVVIDLASTHGTIVNGERVMQVSLEFNDTIEIAGHQLQLLRNRPAESVPEETNVVISPSNRRLDRRVKFFGGLNEFALITLVQFLHQEKQSGLLMLEEGQRPGPRIYFLCGDIIHVTDGDRLGELLTRGTHDQSLFFYFHHETEFPPRTVHHSTPNFLMELCHNQDVVRARPPAATATANGPTPRDANTMTRRLVLPTEAIEPVR